MSEGRVRYSQHDGIGRILFDNPRAYNALTTSMWNELEDRCAAIADDPTIRAVVVQGAGDKAFVSGNDISGFLDFKDGADGVAYEAKVGASVDALEKLRQPTIALIQGWAVGGGLAIALACDFRIAAAGSRFGSPIARTIGNCLSAKSYARILWHVGPALAKRILLLGEVVAAEELHALGLLYDVVTRDALDASGDGLAARLKDNAPLTMGASKEAMRRMAYAKLPDVDDLVESVYGSDDFRTGVRSFVGKTKPEWTGR
jgi:enoyl-CoA hydratase/carnithine racemase